MISYVKFICFLVTDCETGGTCSGTRIGGVTQVILMNS